MHRLDVGAIALCLKRSFLMGHTSGSLLACARPHIVSKLPTASPEMISYLFDALGLLSHKKIYGNIS